MLSDLKKDQNWCNRIKEIICLPCLKSGTYITHSATRLLPALWWVVENMLGLSLLQPVPYFPNYTCSSSFFFNKTAFSRKKLSQKNALVSLFNLNNSAWANTPALVCLIKQSTFWPCFSSFCFPVHIPSSSPLSVSVYNSSMAVSKLEPELRDSIVSQYGDTVQRVYFNKGLWGWFAELNFSTHKTEYTCFCINCLCFLIIVLMKCSSPYVIFKSVLIGGNSLWDFWSVRLFNFFSCFLTLNRHKGHCVLLLRNQMISSQEQSSTLPD